MLLQHPVVRGDTRPNVQLRLFGPTDDDGLQLQRYLSVGYLIAGTVALGLSGKDFNEALAVGLIYAAADPDPEALLLRARLLRGRLFEPPPPVAPEWLEEIDRFAERNCFAGVMKAVLQVSRWAGSRPRSFSTGITQVTPSPVCAGTQLTLHGSGFGAAQPANVSVYVPTTGGGCREAKVESWSDTAVVVRAPPDIGPGCVGFVEMQVEYHEPNGVTGALTACVGAAGQIWARGFDRVQTPPVPCPPCLPNGQNQIHSGGRPVISTFSFSPTLIEPGGQPTLTWSVSNATAAQIARIGQAGPLLPLPSPLPLAGSITLSPVTGLAPITGQYMLTATNVCGTVSRDAEFSMQRKPTLSVTRIEVVQSIQRADNSVRLVARRRTVVRVFVDSGISDGFDFGIGPNRVSGLEAGLIAQNLANGASLDCGSPWVVPAHAGPGLNRDVLSDSINFDVPVAACDGNVRFRVILTQPGPPGAPPTAFADGSVDVAFTPKAQQMLLPILVTDPTSTSPAPTIADFAACLTGPAQAHPFADNGFIIHPALQITLSGAERLSVGANWTWLVMRMQTMVFLFGSQPTGGVRMGIVPRDTSYPWGGMALPRTGAPIPAFIVQAGLAETCTHELGHASGLLHVNCGGASGPYGGLPLTISDPGLNTVTRTLVPSGSSEAMSYCNPQWPSIEHWDHMFNSIPFA